MKTDKEELETALVRLLCGIKKKDLWGCEWYEGILEDAIDEAEELLEGDTTEEEIRQERFFGC